MPDTASQPDREQHGQEHSEADERPGQEQRSRPTASQIVPRALLALVAIAAFVWLGSQMGSGAQTGATPLVVTFGAIILGLLAGAAPFVVRRLSRH